MASKSNANIASKSPLVTQTPPVAKARRVVKPSAPQKKVYKVGSKAVLMPKRVGTITELTNSDTGSGAISATIKIDADGSLVEATLNPSDDFWYPPNERATLYFPGVPGAAVTLAHQVFPHTIQDPKPVPLEATGLAPPPARACDSNPVDENNAVKGKGKARVVGQNKGKAAQGTNKAIACGSETTYTVTRDLESPSKEVSQPPVVSSGPVQKSKDAVYDKAPTTTPLASGSPPAGPTSTALPSIAKKTMAPRARSGTKRKRDSTVSGASKKPKTENVPSTAAENLGGENLGDGSTVVNHHTYNGSYYYNINGDNCTLQLPPVPTSQVISGGHQHATYCYNQYPTFVPPPVAQGAAPPQQAPMQYQAPAPQPGNPLAPYSATQPFAPPFLSGAPALPAGYYRPASYPNSQASPYAVDTQFRDQASSVASTSRGSGSYYRQNPQPPQ
ncbi:hypothetical protein AB1N83_006018 [Pleurotus pulmonarius]|nr:hypothetical protein EYR38_002306 [Pleurotus pulmonarius]